MKAILTAITVLLLTACNQANTNPKEQATLLNYTQADKSALAYTPSPEDETSPVAKNSTKIVLQIIKNSELRFQVKNIRQSHANIAALLANYQAYFASDNQSSNSNNIENNMVIRVPADQFQKLMDEILKESVYTNFKNITATDVTAEFVDIQARLKTKKEVEQRYLALLRQANKVSDILEVEDKLRVIREEIEATEGRLKLLNDEVAYSTITINMYQNLDFTPEPQIGFFSKLKEALVNGWRALVAFTLALVRIWPFVIIGGLLAYYGMKKLRVRRLK